MLFTIFTFPRPLKVLLQLTFDVFCCLLSVWLAFVLRFDSFFAPFPSSAWLSLSMVPLTALLYYKLGLYRGAVRYISDKAFQKMMISALVCCIFIYAINYTFSVGIPRSIPLLQCAVFFILSASSRVFFRGILLSEKENSRVPSAVYGNLDDALKIIAALARSQNFRASAVFLDDCSMTSHEIFGIPVYPLSSSQEGIKLKKIKHVFCMRGKVKLHNLKNFKDQGVVVKLIDDIDKVSAGSQKISSAKNLTITDVLGREEVPPDKALLARRVTGKSIMITGAGGSIGSEICAIALELSPTKIVLVDNSEFALYQIEQKLLGASAQSKTCPKIVPVLASILDRGAILSAFRDNGVENVFHAAAYKHVPLVEANPIVAVRNNVFGVQNVAEISEQLGVESFTLISTDKAVRPTNIMGASKRIAELTVQHVARNQSKTDFGIVRFGNVLGSSGSVIPKFQAQIDAGGPVTVTHREVTRYFMTIPEAARLVLQAASLSSRGEVFILDMGKSIKIVELARNMINLSGYTPYFEDQSVSVDNGLAIRFTGLRAGEKLYEELLVDSHSNPTVHPRIFCDGHQSHCINNMVEILNTLQSVCDHGDVEELKRYFKDLSIGYVES